MIRYYLLLSQVTSCWTKITDCSVQEKTSLSLNNSDLVKHPWSGADDEECRGVKTMFADQALLDILT